MDNDRRFSIMFWTVAAVATIVWIALIIIGIHFLVKVW